MEKSSVENILVTGGTGLVGNALRKVLPEAIYLGSSDYDLTDQYAVLKMFDKFKPQMVVHLAAKVGGIIDNKRQQAEYFYQNILINTNVVHQAHLAGVNKLIAFGSNCAYPDKVASYPLAESQLHDGPPAITNFSYAYAKRALLAQLQAYRTQYNRDYFALIPCSLYGTHDNFEEQSCHFIPALIKKIHQAKSENEKSIKLFGSGRALRQYMYADDLAKVILRFLNGFNEEGPINIAPPENLSIKAIAEIALKAMGAADLRIEFDQAFPDGQFRKDLSTVKLSSIFGDIKMTSLEEGIRQTYKWYSKN